MMENIEKDDLFKFFIVFGILFGAMNGYLSLIEHLKETEIHRKKLEKSRTPIAN